ncbi:MAG: amino acid adenylation domain-containing protein [Vicinamibacterales bacterium]
MSYLLWHGLRDSAKRVPERPAIEWRGESLTYRQLDALSNGVATMLLRAGISRGHRVAIFAPKTHLNVVAMVGASKAGATYVPIDPHAPAARAAYIMEDCGVSAVFTTADRLTSLTEHRASLPALALAVLTGAADSQPEWPRTLTWREIVPSETASWPAAIETDPAYLLYTSGSTGRPKGVIITHRNARTFIEWAAETFDIQSTDRLSNHAPLHFDLSVFDIYVAFERGASVVIVPDQTALFPAELAKWIQQRGITVWYSVPSALVRMLLHGGLGGRAYPSVRIVLFAGEVFPIKFLRDVIQIIPAATFANLYGPTETNVCTFYVVPRDLDPEATSIPIGSACSNTEVFALDEQGHLAAVGQEGELVVRGPAVMAGYWGLPERTEQSLVRNHLQTAFCDTVYRTGDIVRQLPDGAYIFIGRRDHMVKARGYRIELGEIEQVMLRHESIREAVVIPIPDEELGARLYAFAHPHSNATLSPDDLRAFCLAHLPHYMVPETIIIRDELPKTSTGKTDRQALLKALQEGATS